MNAVLRSMDESSFVTLIDDGWPVYCALQGQEMIGMVSVKPPHHLFHLFVRSRCRGLQIGRLLFETADQHTLEHSGCRLNTVNSSLNAIEVYRRFGFVPDGEVTERVGVIFQPMKRV